MRLVLQRSDALQEELHRVQVGRVGQRQVALSLSEAVQDGIESLVLLRLVLAVGVDWGTKSLGRLPLKVTARSRWLVAAMLAFHDESKRIARPTTWELRLSDSAFAARAEGTHLTITAGAPERTDLVITTKDEDLHRLMTHALTPDTAVATGA